MVSLTKKTVSIAICGLCAILCGSFPPVAANPSVGAQPLVEAAASFVLLIFLIATLLDLGTAFSEQIVLKGVTRYAARQLATVPFKEVINGTSQIPTHMNPVVANAIQSGKITPDLMRDLGIAYAEEGLIFSGKNPDQYHIDMWSNNSTNLSIFQIAVSKKNRGPLGLISGFVVDRCAASSAFPESRQAVTPSDPPNNPSCNPGEF